MRSRVCPGVYEMRLMSGSVKYKDETNPFAVPCEAMLQRWLSSGEPWSCGQYAPWPG